MSVPARSESDSGIASYIRNFVKGIVALSVVGLAISALSRAAIDGSTGPHAWDTTVKMVAFSDTNLSEFGVPNFEGAEPYKSILIDKLDQVEGNETRKDYYKIDGIMVNVYTIGEDLFFVSLDNDWRFPLDLALIDRSGTHEFVEFSTRQRSEVPAWLIDQILAEQEAHYR